MRMPGLGPTMDHRTESVGGRNAAAGDGARRDRERGLALILGILFTIVVSGIVISGTMLLRAHRQKTETAFHLHGQAAQFARAGLIEALGWFRKQTSQPVLAFAPVLDTTSTPKVLDTLEPDIGLVREFQISGATWGRYEVWKQWDADPQPERLAWRQQIQVEDVSLARGANSAGSVWRLRCIGYVFHQADPGVSFDTPPNRVVSQDTLETEVRRMTFTPPGAATLCVDDLSNLTIDGRVNVQGNGVGACYGATGSPTYLNSPTVVGGWSTGIYDSSYESVFGLGEDDLRSLADDRVTVDADFPNPLPRNTFYFVDVPALNFTDARPLRGTALVVVKGDVVFQSASKSFFSGMLYVDGDVTIDDPAELNGTIVCNGTVTIQGAPDWIFLTHDSGVLDALRLEIGQYRLSSAIRRVHAVE